MIKGAKEIGENCGKLWMISESRWLGSSNVVSESRTIGIDVPLRSIRKESRAALLASKRAIDANALSNREELLRSTVVREKQDLHEQVACVRPCFNVS